ASRLDQHRGVADIGAFLEIEPEQATREAVLHAWAGCRRPAQDAVGVERVGGDLDGVECELDSLGTADLFETHMELSDPFLAAELGGEIGFAIPAFGRDRGIELIGPPADVDRNCGYRTQCPLKPFLPDIAPRADYDRDDVDSDRGRIRQGNLLRLVRGRLAPP